METNELKETLDLKDHFASKRHSEKVELIHLRDNLMTKVIMLRDKMAGKRHSERIMILNKKY